MEITIWQTEQESALYSADFGAELFVFHCRISFQEGMLLKHCIPACLFGISPLSLEIKS